jgi:hypothetical protein
MHKIEVEKRGWSAIALLCYRVIGKPGADASGVGRAVLYVSLA